MSPDTVSKKHRRWDFQVEALPLVLRLVVLWKEANGGGEGSVHGGSLSFLYQSVDVMLGAVLAVWNFKNTGHAQQRLLGVPIRHHLQDRSRFKPHR